MRRCRLARSSTACTFACLLAACQSADIDENDHEAYFVDARVRKQLDDTDDHSGPYGELGWTSTHGSAGALDYTIGTANLGAGFEVPALEQVWFGFGGGFSLQFNDLETSVGTLEEENVFGGYVALDGGWHATSWLEPCARYVSTVGLDELATTQQFEAGVRLHFIEHTALFVGWRDARYEIEDVSAFGFSSSSVELDTSGWVAGLSLSF